MPRLGGAPSFLDRVTARYFRKSCSSDLRTTDANYTYRVVHKNSDNIDLFVRLVDPLVLGAEPFKTQCPQCQSRIVTNVQPGRVIVTNYNREGPRQMLGLLCCMRPYPTQIRQSYRHGCPSCGAFLALGGNPAQPTTRMNK